MFSQVDVNSFDCLIVGGGLAGGLFFYALRRAQPNLRILLIEKSESLGGNHTWSFHLSDLSSDIEWLTPLISRTWPSYEVRFPDYVRVIEKPYCSIRAEDFDHVLRQQHGEYILLNADVVSVESQTVTLSGGRVLQARQVVDARGWRPSGANAGFQKFVGLDIKLKDSHGMKHVLLKDARVSQTDGYRFFYVLPWGPREVLVEDTYYSNTANLDVDAVRGEVLRYVASCGWEVESIERQEIGCLPLELNKKKVPEDDGVLRLGAAAGVYQPVTGYTFPQTLERVHALAQVPMDQWQSVLQRLNRRHHKQATYLRALNRMMFLAAVPEKRYIILQRFYGLSEGLIARFYKGQLSLADKLRILCGRPPVSIWRALKSLFG